MKKAIARLKALDMQPIVKPLLLYSANTYLAYMISEHFYHRRHYVWCTPFFDPSKKARLECAVPPSSSPAEIYRDLHEAIVRGDGHNSKISANRAGLTNGAHEKRRAEEISVDTLRDVLSVIDQARIDDFKPLVYVIPFERVEDALEAVPVASRANPFSVEFVIKELRHTDFDVIEP